VSKPAPLYPEPGILQNAIDPATEDLAAAVARIKAGVERLTDDPGAVLTEEMLDAWTGVYVDDPAEYERQRKRVKEGKARVTEIDKFKTLEVGDSGLIPQWLDTT
jgi:hypothetical protein